MRQIPPARAAFPSLSVTRAFALCSQTTCVYSFWSAQSFKEVSHAQLHTHDQTNAHAQWHTQGQTHAHAQLHTHDQTHAHAQLHTLDHMWAHAHASQKKHKLTLPPPKSPKIDRAPNLFCWIFDTILSEPVGCGETCKTYTCNTWNVCTQRWALISHWLWCINDILEETGDGLLFHSSYDWKIVRVSLIFISFHLLLIVHSTLLHHVVSKLYNSSDGLYKFPSITNYNINNISWWG